MTYQGHHSDGSSIQKHSAGSHYPYIVGKQEGQTKPWFVMAPSGDVIERCHTATYAFDFADECARQLRFANEQRAIRSIST